MPSASGRANSHHPWMRTPVSEPSRRPSRPAVRCSAHSSRTGEPCGAYAVHGANVCRAHGGSVPHVKRAAARRLAEAAAARAVARETARLGGSLEVDPLDVLLQSVREAWANVAVLRMALEELGVEVARDGAIALPERDVEWDKGGTHVPARVHILVGMYNEERDRAARYAKLCLDAGVDERRVRVAEQQAQALGNAVGRALDDATAALTAEQRQALRSALARELRAIGGGE